MSDTTTTGAEPPAAFAWHMLTRPQNTMPLQAGLDWLRTAMGETDDVGAVKRALYAAAADAMAYEDGGYIPQGGPLYLRNARFDHATTWFLGYTTDRLYMSPWREDFGRALALCEQIAAL